MSITAMRHVNRTILLACTPFLGMLLWMLVANIGIQLTPASFPEHDMQPKAAIESSTQALNGLEQAQSTAIGTSEALQRQIRLYNQTNTDMKKIAAVAKAQATRPLQIYDNRITA